MLNALLSGAMTLALMVAGAYAGYALWDNEQVYAAAENVQADMLAFKPQPDADGESGPTFEELLAINPDVRAWITMDNTRIDYPVLRGKHNLSYINTDVYGNFALAGSIFMDVRGDEHFEGGYALLYGHHMKNGSMFGDLALYKDEAFFRQNRTGTLMLPDRAYSLTTFACLLADASDGAIFDPAQWQDDIDGLLEYARVNALYLDGEAIEAALADKQATGPAPKVLALSTCSSEFTNARTVVLAFMTDYMPAI